MRNKKAYLLNEMILIIALISVIMLLSVEPVRIFFRSVLDTHKAFDRQGQLEMLLEQLRHDTEHAAFAFVHKADERLGGDLLYLTGPEGVACYQLADGAAMCIRNANTQEWELPRVVFDWRLLALPGDGQALAITAQQTHKRRGDGVPAFRGSRVFVVNLNPNLQTTEQP